MTQDILKKIKDAGIVGAGGAGFPTHVKLKANAEVVIINGAECEPLLRVDQQLMEVYAEELVEGLEIAISLTKAQKGVICLKGKYKAAIERLQPLVDKNELLELKIIKDYYPAGDEQQLVYEVTKKVVPLGGIPLDVGAVVINVNTAINVARSVPVTERIITVTGAVKNPQTLIAPIGMAFRELIEICEGPKDLQNYSMIVGGPMMGSIEPDWDSPVTKLTGGIIILPKEHMLIGKKTRKLQTDFNLTKAICCQCMMCTEMCPRYIIGLNTEPHKVMRGLVNEDAASVKQISSVVSCCNCNLCSLYACPMDLDPGKITAMVKQSLLKKGAKVAKEVPYEVDPLRDSKKVPTKRLVSRLELDEYNVAAPLNLQALETNHVRILMKQHIGVMATPLVKTGEYVLKDSLIATCNESLGANIHASIAGKVTYVTDRYIEIEA